MIILEILEDGDDVRRCCCGWTSRTEKKNQKKEEQSVEEGREKEEEEKGGIYAESQMMMNLLFTTVSLQHELGVWFCIGNNVEVALRETQRATNQEFPQFDIVLLESV